MKLAIFEPSATGHHMILHVRHIAREALARGWHVRLVTTPRAWEHSATQVVLGECNGRLRTSLMGTVDADGNSGSRWGLMRQQWRQYQAFADAYKEIASTDRPDVVYVVHLNYLDKLMCLRGSPFADAPFAGVLLSPRFHHRHAGVKGEPSWMDGPRYWSFLRLLRMPSLRRVLTIDETLPEFVRSRRLALEAKLRYVPDIGALAGSCSREEARRVLGLKDDDCVILVYGSITSRKGVEHLLRAVANPCCRRRVVVLLAGQIDAEMGAVLQRQDMELLRRQGQLVERRGMLADEQEWEVFRAADIVWLGYRGFYGMSGVLAQAGSLGLPVIACSEGLIGWMCGKYGLGEVVEVGDTGQVVEAINRLAEDKGRREQRGQETALFAARHSPQNFARTICDAISTG
jgi:glycosyltransferase involved in cell wall biosynthesis